MDSFYDTLLTLSVHIYRFYAKRKIVLVYHFHFVAGMGCIYQYMCCLRHSLTY